MRIKPKPSASRIPALADAANLRTSRLARYAHAQAEVILGDDEWFAGPHRTLADAYFIGIARWGAYHRVVTPGQYPQVQRLIERLEDDPAVIFAHAIEDERPATSSGGFRGHVTIEEFRGRG